MLSQMVKRVKNQRKHGTFIKSYFANVVKSVKMTLNSKNRKQRKHRETKKTSFPKE